MRQGFCWGFWLWLRLQRPGTAGQHGLDRQKDTHSSFRRASHCWRRGSRCLHHPNQELKQTLTATCEIRTLQSVSTSIHYTFFTLAYQRRIANPNHNLIEGNPRKIGVPSSPAQIPSQMMTGDGRSAHQLLYSIWFLNTKDASLSKRPVA